MVQSEVFSRVFRFTFGQSAGTTFTLENGDKQFLVTAKHIFRHEGFPNCADIKIFKDGKYSLYHVKIKYPEDSEVDIAVMQIDPMEFISPTFANPYSGAGLVYGQDVFFVGFPYNYDTLLQSLPNSSTPVPFVKKACLSGVLKSHSLLVLDGHNNRGFSGSPVCFKPTDPKVKTMSICAVVSGYRFEQEPVFDKDGKETGLFVRSNTGIINAYDIKEAVTVANNWDS